MNLHFARLPSPIGIVLLIFEGEAVHALDFEDYEPRMHRLLRLHYGEVDLTPADPPPAIAQAIAAYFDGDITALDDISVQTGGTDFQRRVWTALRDIPAGETTSYGRLAAQIGHPKASRAVGLANGSNPVAIIVPCHRVVGANASLTGYGGGLERKAWLLEHERRAARPDLLG